MKFKNDEKCDHSHRLLYPPRKLALDDVEEIRSKASEIMFRRDQQAKAQEEAARKKEKEDRKAEKGKSSKGKHDKGTYRSQHKGSSYRSSSHEQTPNASSAAYKGSSKGDKRKRTSQSQWCGKGDRYGDQWHSNWRGNWSWNSW